MCHQSRHQSNCRRGHCGLDVVFTSEVPSVAVLGYETFKRRGLAESKEGEECSQDLIGSREGGIISSACCLLPAASSLPQ